jgi:hypothetical protein
LGVRVEVRLPAPAGPAILSSSVVFSPSPTEEILSRTQMLCLHMNVRFAPKAAYQKVSLLIALVNRDESR